MIDWLKARLRERSTKVGLILIAGAVAAGPLGFNYADFRDAVMVAVCGTGLALANTTGKGDGA